VWTAHGFNLIIDPSGMAPIDAPKLPGEDYVDAAAKLAQLARLLKAIDPSSGVAAPSKPISVDAIDACMLSELALLDAVLR
jgi:hypothetical protein